MKIRSTPEDYFEWLVDGQGDPGAEVDPGPDPFTVGSGGAAVTGSIYRYVTWRADDCTSTICPGQDTKRITVAITVDSGAGLSRPVWLSSVVGDPDAQPVDTAAGGPPGGDASLTTQRFYLGDWPCHGQQPPYTDPTRNTDHPTHETATTDEAVVPPDERVYANNSSCRSVSGTRSPDLMSEDYPEPYRATRADIPPLYKYSADTGDSGSYGGLRMRKDSGHFGDCDSAPVDYPYGDEENQAGPNKWTVHRWSSGRFAEPFRLTGRVWLSMFTQQLNAGSSPGLMCVKLIERSEPTPGTTDPETGEPAMPRDVRELASCTIGDWDRPERVELVTRQIGSPDLNCDLNPGPVDIAAGNNLVLVISMRCTSADDLKFLYAHTLYPSRLLVETVAP